MSLSRCLLIAAASLAVGSVAVAQQPPSARIRGAIETVDAHELDVVTRGGDTVKMKLADDARVTLILPISVDAIKPGSFIGTAAVTQPDGTLKALEIQVFPEAMRGVGEGHQLWDVAPGSTMTNGTVGDLKVSNGRMLTLTYKGGEQKVYVPEGAPVVTYQSSSKADLKPGAHVIVTAVRNPDETLTATRIGVGKDGLVPPY
jgi:hypothetical protein